MGSLGSYNENPKQWADVLPKGSTFYWRMQPPKSKVRHVSMADVGKEGQAGQPKGIVTTNQLTPPPRLEPINDPYDGTTVDRAMSSEAATTPSTHINVRDEHHWTESPMSARGEVPTLSLKEYDVLQNSGINQILNQIGITVGNANDTIATLKKWIAEFSGKGGIEKAIESFKKHLESFDSAGPEAGTIARIPDQILGSADPMDVYKYLYSRKPTGFKYSFPYMENMQFKTTGGFTDTPELKGFMGLVGDASEFLSKLSGSLAGRFTEPGRYIEQPKNYSFDGRQKNIVVNFPLFNTKNYAEIIKNWQFLFLLTYQNTPARITKDVIRPPVQYEAYIPGSWYCKYASITDMTVNFRGARREMDIPVPFLDRAENDGENWLLQKRFIKTIIPDAYEVSITLSEIFGESQNTLYHMLAQSTDFKVQTGVIDDMNAAQWSDGTGGFDFGTPIQGPRGGGSYA